MRNRTLARLAFMPSIICIVCLMMSPVLAGTKASFMGKLEGADSFVGDGSFTGSSAYIQLWLDKAGDGLSAPVPGRTANSDDLLIREVAIAGETGVFGTKVLDSTDGLVPGSYWVRGIASPAGTPGISSINGTNGSDSARVSGSPGFGSAPAVASIYGDARLTLDGGSYARVTDTDKAPSFFVLDPGASDNPGVVLLDTPYPASQ